MAIKLQARPRAILHPEFWDAVLLFTDEIGLSVVKAIRGAKNQRHAEKLARDYAHVLSNMKAARARDPKLETTLIHSAWDEIGSNLQGELVFTKNNPIMRPIRYADRNNSYYIGKYTCVVKRDAFSVSSPKPNRVFFLPQYDVADHPSLVNNIGRNRANHPHQTASGTCWGGYSAWVMTSLKRFNLADLQDAMYKFLTHWTPNDTLARPTNSSVFPWYKEYHASDN